MINPSVCELSSESNRAKYCKSIVSYAHKAGLRPDLIIKVVNASLSLVDFVGSDWMRIEQRW